MRHRRIVVLGGTGFIGRHLVATLAAEDREIVVVTRRREHAQSIVMVPRVEIVEADARDATALAMAARDADALINLVGILHSGRDATFDSIHVGVTEAALRACRSNRIVRYLHMSALNADPDGPSEYLRTKGVAEAKVRAAGGQWTIFRPSVVFGVDDHFINTFAGLARWFPIIPLAGAHSRFQPVHVADVVRAFHLALDEPATVGQAFALCGPRVYSLRELMVFAGALRNKRPFIIALPGALGRVQAALLEWVPGTPMSRDNLDSMRVDSVCDQPWPAMLGAQPRSLESFAADYMSSTAGDDRYAAFRTRRR